MAEVVVLRRSNPDGRPLLTLLGRVYLGVAFVFLFLPIITLLVFSFQKNQYASIPGQGWSLRWYEKLFSDDMLLSALSNSLIVSPIAATVASIIGFCAAYAVNRFVFPGRSTLAVVIVLPILIPPLILGIGFLGLLSRLHLEGQLLSVIIAHVALTTPAAMAIIQLRLSQLPASLEEASWNLGATEWQTLWKVVLPCAASGIAGGWLLAFTFSFDEFVIAWFVSGFQPTLPVTIYTYLAASADPSLNAIASIIFVFSGLLLAGAELLVIPMVIRASSPGRRSVPA
ncbi:ABC transporter permease [Mesorhizobium sp.]|uniref:ABC transporter permease n=1 Tax=Mesorhizobium sp. TaxID=1871066 RepID=UPI000FE969F8|nr:ABC transporter permease [Mesorhizobium sp.]RWC33553.1 MAG: ABC transporter permease [Mesorhizobium sp.]TIX27804.1 MAG: ABC transporter permease [Mesorhizobium sp.]